MPYLYLKRITFSYFRCDYYVFKYVSDLLKKCGVNHFCECYLKIYALLYGHSNHAIRALHGVHDDHDVS